MGSAMQTAFCQGSPNSETKIGPMMNRKETEVFANTNQNKDQKTPMKQYFSNPFEINLPERLQLPAMSPSCFKHVSPKEDAEKPFRWSIEQMANLHPAEIDDVTCLQQYGINGSADHEYEQKAQEAINHYFSQNQIVPSPWLNTNELPKSISFTTTLSSSEEVVKRSKPILIPRCQTVSTQTTLTLPVDFDLEKYLGKFYTQLEPSPIKSAIQEEDNALNTSNLRRKLFFQEESSPDNFSSESPIHLSSSPVKHVKNRTSVSPMGLMLSPTVSPISSAPSNYDLSDDNNTQEVTTSMISFSSQNAVLSVSEIINSSLHREVKTYETDTGYSTYDPDTIKSSRLDNRMSWVPTIFTTPNKAQCSQLAMSIEEERD